MKHLYLLLSLAFCSFISLDAADAAAVLAEAKKNMPEEAWADLGSDAWPKAIETAWSAEPDLNEADTLLLRLHLIEAWLGANDVNQAEQQLSKITFADVPEALRDRFGNAVILHWRQTWPNQKDQAQVTSASKHLKQIGNFSKAIRARAHVAEASRLIFMKQAKKALIQYDAAYALMKGASMDERITLLQLRLTCMEAADVRQAAILDWFDRRKNDEAVKAMAAGMFSKEQKMLGTKVPAALSAATVKIKDDSIAMNQPYRVIFVFATWSKGSAESAPVLATALKEMNDKIGVLGVSIDTKESVKEIEGFLQRYDLKIPVIEEQAAWESKLIKQLHIEAVPTILLIDKQGRILANDIQGAEAKLTDQRLRESIQSAAQGIKMPDEQAEKQQDPVPEDESEDFP